MGTHARLMLAPNNYSAQGAWGSSAPSWVAPIKGSVVVHAEAWSDRVGGKQLGVSNTLALFFDHTFSSIRFLPPVVTSLGPGEGLIEFPARAEDAARLARAAVRGGGVRGRSGRATRRALEGLGGMAARIL